MKTIEIKKPEEILKQTIPGLEYSFQFNNRSDIIKAMQAYADQEVSKAIDKALEIASEKGETMPHCTDCMMPYCDTCYDIIDKQSILSLKPEILKELVK